jgi:type II secretory pathway pseudopilin PulG
MSLPEQPDPSAPAKTFDTRFFSAVMILLLVIVVLLTGLWMRAYRRQIRAENAANQAALQFQDMQDLAKQMLANKPLQFSVDRASLPHGKAVVNDREVDVLLLPPRLGKAIGFEAGDVILVEEPSATQPTSAPATMPVHVPEGSQG